MAASLSAPPDADQPPGDLPLARRLPGGLDAADVLRRLAGRPRCLLLDSPLAHERLGRYWFAACDPFDWLEAPVGDDPAVWDELARRHERWRGATAPGLPPFQGGAAGLWSYDLNRSLERLPAPRFDEFALPALAIGWYDVVVAGDRLTGEAWIVSQGFPETEPDRRRRRAHERLVAFTAWLTEPAPPLRHPSVAAVDRRPTTGLAPQHAIAGHAGLSSNFAPGDYLAAVERAIEYIRAGDIFQVNLAQRLLYPHDGDALGLYQRLRERNAATFAGYFDGGEWQVLSASPERFVRVRERHVEARPIKGTRRRSAHAVASLFAADELQASAKDRAENIMIVDLLRNDLARVCRPDSIRVSQLCGLETYAYVQHLVSVVEGELDDRHTPLDLLRAAFPGGSITGAPKVRAMEIIAELEPTARGAYCGSLGYLGFDGALDLSILIRTITAAGGWLQLPVGGGIVAASHPNREYEETWHKAEGMLRALR